MISSTPSSIQRLQVFFCVEIPSNSPDYGWIQWSAIGLPSNMYIVDLQFTVPSQI